MAMVARYALFRVLLIFRSALEQLPFTSWLLADWDERLPQKHPELAAGVKSWKWDTGLGMGWGTCWSDFEVGGWVDRSRASCFACLALSSSVQGAVGYLFRIFRMLRFCSHGLSGLDGR